MVGGGGIGGAFFLAYLEIRSSTSFLRLSSFSFDISLMALLPYIDVVVVARVPNPP